MNKRATEAAQPLTGNYLKQKNKGKKKKKSSNQGNTNFTTGTMTCGCHMSYVDDGWKDVLLSYTLSKEQV